MKGLLRFLRPGTDGLNRKGTEPVGKEGGWGHRVDGTFTEADIQGRSRSPISTFQQRIRRRKARTTSPLSCLGHTRLYNYKYSRLT